MKNICKALVGLGLLSVSLISQAQSFGTGLMFGAAMGGNGGPSKTQIQTMIEDEVGRRDAMAHETQLDSRLNAGMELQITKLTGHAKTRVHTITHEPELRLKLDSIELEDPKQGKMTCGTHLEEDFWYCKPINPDNPMMYTASWEPYFVPREPRHTGWGQPLEFTPPILDTPPSQYSRYLILFLSAIQIKDDSGNLFSCPTSQRKQIKCKLLQERD